MLDDVVTCEEKVSIFNNIVVNTINTIMPITAKKIHINEAPWMTTKLRGLNKKRQKALNNGNETVFKYYRNKVNLGWKKCRQTYFHKKVKSLKYTKPKDWWRAVKKISGMDPTLKPNILSCLQIEEFQQLDKLEIANQINDSFLEPLQRFQALNSSNYVNALDDSNISDSNMLTVSEYEVYRCLKSLDSSKSTGPDNITSWVLKENAEVLALPVCKIFNSSYEEQRLPSSWKMSNVVPIPKTTPIEFVNKHLRPISLTQFSQKLPKSL